MLSGITCFKFRYKPVFLNSNGHLESLEEVLQNVYAQTPSQAIAEGISGDGNEHQYLFKSRVDLCMVTGQKHFSRANDETLGFFHGFQQEWV